MRRDARKIPSAAAQRANSQAESLRSDKPLMFRLLVSLLKWLKPRRYADEGPRERSVESEWHYPEGDKRRTRRKFHRSAFGSDAQRNELTSNRQVAHHSMFTVDNGSAPGRLSGVLNMTHAQSPDEGSSCGRICYRYPPILRSCCSYHSQSPPVSASNYGRLREAAEDARRHTLTPMGAEATMGADIGRTATLTLPDKLLCSVFPS